MPYHKTKKKKRKTKQKGGSAKSKGKGRFRAQTPSRSRATKPRNKLEEFKMKYKDHRSIPGGGNANYDTAYREISEGQKKTCWSWYIWPVSVFDSRGTSQDRQMWSLTDQECVNFILDPELGPRWLNIMEQVLRHAEMKVNLLVIAGAPKSTAGADRWALLNSCKLFNRVALTMDTKLEIVKRIIDVTSKILSYGGMSHSSTPARASSRSRASSPSRFHSQKKKPQHLQKSIRKEEEAQVAEAIRLSLAEGEKGATKKMHRAKKSDTRVGVLGEEDDLALAKALSLSADTMVSGAAASAKPVAAKMYKPKKPDTRVGVLGEEDDLALAKALSLSADTMVSGAAASAKPVAAKMYKPKKPDTRVGVLDEEDDLALAMALSLKDTAHHQSDGQ